MDKSNPDDAASSARGEKLVREFGISNSTLEEVFLRLAAANQGVNQGGNAPQNPSPLAQQGAVMGSAMPLA